MISCRVQIQRMLTPSSFLGRPASLAVLTPCNFTVPCSFTHGLLFPFKNELKLHLSNPEAHDVPINLGTLFPPGPVKIFNPIDFTVVSGDRLWS